MSMGASAGRCAINVFRSRVVWGACRFLIVVITCDAGITIWHALPRLVSPLAAADSTAAGAPERAVDRTSPGVTGGVLTTEEIAGRCERAIALVTGRRHTGTGFLVRPGVLATNVHVLAQERMEDVRVDFPAAHSRSMKAELIYEDPQRDLALLAVPTDLAPLEIDAGYRFRRGQDVTVIGNPGAGDKVILKNAVSRGVMSAEAMIEGQSFYQLNIAVNPGNSGGPTIGSSGKVIGVVTRKATRLEGTAFCIPAADLLSALAKANSPSHDRDAVNAMHRARYVAAYLDVTGELYSRALGAAVSAMDMAVAHRLDPDLAIEIVRREMTELLSEVEALFIDHFDREVERVYHDARLGDSVRDELSRSILNCSDMKTTIDGPVDLIDRFRARVSLLQGKHRLCIERLRAELAMAG